MPDIFIWKPNENQTYSTAGTNEVSAPSFDKEAGKSFSMIAPAGTLTLLSRQSSVWGGSFDNDIPPVEIDLRSGALVMRGISGDARGVDFTMARIRTSSSVTRSSTSGSSTPRSRSAVSIR